MFREQPVDHLNASFPPGNGVVPVLHGIQAENTDREEQVRCQKQTAHIDKGIGMRDSCFRLNPHATEISSCHPDTSPASIACQQTVFIGTTSYTFFIRFQSD